MLEVGVSAPTECLKFIVGNKKDLLAQRKITVEQGQGLAQSKDAFFFETSAVDDQDKSVEQVFYLLAARLLERKKKVDANHSSESTDVEAPNRMVNLKQDRTHSLKSSNKKKSNCCSG